MQSELIVFVDEDGQPTGETGPKLESHTDKTRLHLAFSCYIFRKRDNKFLVTQRALSKKVWPGVWTNSCCGHPLPGEPVHAAVIRRLAFELGLQVERVDLLLPDFSYRAVMENGTVEHEICPVYRAVVSVDARPNPDEVAEVKWLPWDSFAEGVLSGAMPISPWAREQIPLLVALGPAPLAWPVADEDRLPPVARPLAR